MFSARVLMKFIRAEVAASGTNRNRSHMQDYYVSRLYHAV
jgi:hypothetical protein